MKTINNFIVEHLKYSTFSINEKLKISSRSKTYNYFPKDKFELRKILEERLAKDKNADLNDIDVSQITYMGVIRPTTMFKEGLFEGLDPHDIDISNWDVSKVTNMSAMFRNCQNFTGKGLENWNVSNCKNMISMFYDCKNFNCDLSDWDVSNVTDMTRMFHKCENFKGKGLGNWNVSNVTGMGGMFKKCEKFDCDLSKWDVGKVENMYYMFYGCHKFISDLNNWNVSNVKNMECMFSECYLFNIKNKPSWYKN